MEQTRSFGARPNETSTAPGLAERLSRLRLYVITAADESPEQTLETVCAACDAGAGAVQLRRKGEDARITMRLAERCREIVGSSSTLLIVNDRVDIAMAAGADGVHLGQDDLPLAAARRLWPQGLVGRSTHSLSQAMAAQAEGSDYIGVGPVWATPTKPGRPAVGLELVRSVAAAGLRIPWVAIGGVDAGSVAEVLHAGARAVAVVRAVSTAANPRAAVQSLHAAVNASVAAA
jgi:thiamine-phosphate pyrophosphorylase